MIFYMQITVWQEQPETGNMGQKSFSLIYIWPHTWVYIENLNEKINITFIKAFL